MSSEMLFKVKDKVFAKKENCPPWPGIISDILVSDVLPQPIYNVYLYGTGENVKCLSKDLFPYEENKSELGKPNNKENFAKALEQIENNFRVPVLNKDDSHVCLKPGEINSEEQDESKNIDVQPNKLLTTKTFKGQYPIFNDIFSKKPTVLLKKFDCYIKPLTGEQNNKTADENIDTNEANSNIIDQHTETFETTESALESSNASPSNNNEITFSSNNNSDTLCVSRYGRILNKTIFFTQPSFKNIINKRYKIKRVPKKSNHSYCFVHKRWTNNSNQRKITDAAEASKDVTKAGNSSDIDAASHSCDKSKSKISRPIHAASHSCDKSKSKISRPIHAASHSCDKSKSKISRPIHATSNTKDKWEIDNLDEMAYENNISFLEAAVDMMNYLCELHNSLQIDNTNYKTALNMLILINELPIDMPMLLQHPIIFVTFQKLSNYVGNSMDLKDCRQILQIKQISNLIFSNKIQSLFILPMGATIEGVFYKAVMDNLGKEI